jgi:hypothetical protein
MENCSLSPVMIKIKKPGLSRKGKKPDATSVPGEQKSRSTASSTAARSNTGPAPLTGETSKNGTDGAAAPKEQPFRAALPKPKKVNPLPLKRGPQRQLWIWSCELRKLTESLLEQTPEDTVWMYAYNTLRAWLQLIQLEAEEIKAKAERKPCLLECKRAYRALHTSCDAMVCRQDWADEQKLLESAVRSLNEFKA